VEIVNEIIDNAPLLLNKNINGNSLFYSSQVCASGKNHLLSTICYFFYFIVIPLIFSIQPIKARINHFDSMLIVREKSYRMYWVKVFATNALLTGCFYFLIQNVRILLIHFFYAPFKFNVKDYTLEYYYIFENYLLNFIAFIVFSCLGQILFSTLILAIGKYLKNYVIYLMMGFITGTCAMVIPACLGMFIMRKHSSIIPHIFCLNTLIIPGLHSLGAYAPNFNGGLAYCFSFIFYSILTFLLIAARMQLDKTEKLFKFSNTAKRVFLQQKKA
jgi:hypothetical protein